MKTVSGWICVLGVGLLGLTGCHRGANQDAARVEGLEKAFPGLAAVEVPAELPASGGDAKVFVRMAVDAHRLGDLAGAAILLKRAMRASGMSLEQVNAVQAARTGWTGELRVRADRGDEQAKAGLAAVSAAR